VEGARYNSNPGPGRIHWCRYLEALRWSKGVFLSDIGSESGDVAERQIVVQERLVAAQAELELRYSP
jgi:hypothetical protein